MIIDYEKMQEIARIGDQRARVYLAAVEYTNRGFSVIPLRKDGKELPAKASGVNYLMASKKKKVIERWFNPTSGKYSGWNIGIVTGLDGGVFVIDTDVKSKVNGIDQLVELQKEHGEFDLHPIQSTPSGGQHHLFTWQENCISGTSNIASGIDTRGGYADRPGGHIVVFPSTIRGRAYEWIAGGAVPVLPNWIINMLGVQQVFISKEVKSIISAKPVVSMENHRGSEEVTKEDEEKIVSVKEIRELLNHIDINDLTYDEWLWTGQAINTQYPGREGLELWDSWSKNGARYKPNECAVRWQGFDPTGPIRINTLFYIAKEHGYSSETTSFEKELVDKLNAEFAVIVVGNKIRILREKSLEGLEPWMSAYDLLTKDDFMTLMSNKLHPGLTAAGRPTLKSEATIWLASENRREYPRGMGFFPGKKAPSGVFNTWTGWPVKPTEEGDCSMFLDHVHEIICSGSQELTDIVFDWIADIIQDPQNPKGTALVLRGLEGTGKGTLYKWISPLFGLHALQLIDEAHLTGQFNAHLMDVMLLFADEITWGGNKKSAGKLKGLVTEQFIIGERKGIDAVRYRNYIRLLVSSNASWVVPAGPTSRRWNVLDVSKRRKGDMAYFKELHSKIPEGVGSLMKFLLDREINVNKIRESTVTEALMQQRAISFPTTDSIAAWWMEKLSDGDIGEIPNEGEVDLDDEDSINNPWPTVIDRMAAYEDYVFWCTSRKQHVDSKPLFYSKMLELGLTECRPGRRGQTRKYKYEIPKIEEAIKRFEKHTHMRVKKVEIS